MKYTIVHLSDLHYRKDWHEESELVCEHLLRDINEECRKRDNVYVAFGGDLAFSADENDVYRHFLERFEAGLNLAGIARSRRFVVPGNHDVSRAAIQSQLTVRNGALSALNKEKLFNDNVRILANQYFDAQFLTYRDCEKKFAEYTCCAEGIGGAGWDLPGGLGVYCLNTALTSSAGLTDNEGVPVNDKSRLSIDTRTLHQWLGKSTSQFRVLLAHHPFDWLQDWAKTELERVADSSFQVVLTGHVHSVNTFAAVRSVRQTVFCAAPALFTRKNDTLGYAILEIDTSSRTTSVHYRQWVDLHRRFVVGAALAGNNTGVANYKLPNSDGDDFMKRQLDVDQGQQQDTLSLLKRELEDALVNYSSKPVLWIERDLATVPETRHRSGPLTLTTPTQLALSLRNCVIRAPAEFGLTCVGKKIAYEHRKQSVTEDVCVYVNVPLADIHRRAVETHLKDRLKALRATDKKIVGIVVDGWKRDKKGQKLVEILREMQPNVVLILLEQIEVGRDIERFAEVDSVQHGELLYLWALTQNRVRELVESYVEDFPTLDPTSVTLKIIKDISTLNIFRTPQNCLMFLRLAEHAFDDSPVNRTELIHRLLFLLFCRFDQIPTYASRPDLKDCEYVLGYLCEWLHRENRSCFTKQEFFSKAEKYCEDQFVNVDLDVLFTFLVATRIVVFHGSEFEFRFSYWLDYFAAHRMHHDTAFAEYIFSERRYARTPSIIEFYTGIDRRRVDAIRVLTRDLNERAAIVSQRTGIAPDFNPHAIARWTPSDSEVAALKSQIESSIARSSLPDAIKHAIADQKYDPSRPYVQRVREFLSTTSLAEMFYLTRGAARALRNSDHVPPTDKLALMDAIMTSWTRASQVVALLSRILAEHDHVACEGQGFLVVGLEGESSIEKRWIAIINSIPDNILHWFEDDLYSSKLGPLIYRYLKDHRGTTAEMLLMMLLIQQHPEGWAEQVKQYIIATPKDAFGLMKVFNHLRTQRDIGFVSEADRERMDHLSATALAKHRVGSTDPNRDAVRKAAEILGDKLPPSSSELRHSKRPRRDS